MSARDHQDLSVGFARSSNDQLSERVSFKRPSG